MRSCVIEKFVVCSKRPRLLIVGAIATSACRNELSNVSISTCLSHFVTL